MRLSYITCIIFNAKLPGSSINLDSIMKAGLLNASVYHHTFIKQQSIGNAIVSTPVVVVRGQDYKPNAIGSLN